MTTTDELISDAINDIEQAYKKLIKSIDSETFGSLQVGDEHALLILESATKLKKIKFELGN